MRAARAQVRRWQLGKVRLAGRAESAGRNSVICERQPGTGILRNRRRAGTGGAMRDSDTVKVPLRFRRGGDPRWPHRAAALLIPPLREKEEGAPRPGAASVDPHRGGTSGEL